MYKKMIVVIGISLTGLFAFYLGCSKKEDIKDPDIKAQMQRIEEMKVKRENRSAELKKMAVKPLVEELFAESQRGLEPFNSMAYEEIVSRGREAASELSAYLNSTEQPFLLGLLALRKINPDEYKKLKPERRIKPLTVVLENAKFFNAFGVPHISWEDAAKAIIEEGPAAKEYLIPLLKNTRAAPVWGSEGTVINETYKYRVCDYAWKMLLDIDRIQIEVPEDISKRDSLILEYINSNK
jgi:hypothetical protein